MRLQQFFLSDNNLSSSLPPQFFQYTLAFVDLSRNNFSGELPDNIGDANGLILLILSGNNFYGSLPSSMSNMSYLTLLDLSDNKFSGNTFPMFGDLLEFIDISSNEFSGEIPIFFTTETIILALGNNKFSGELPETFANMTNLVCLDLHNVRIGGRFPDFLTQINTLYFLNLRNTSLEGPLSNKISELRNLQILDLSNNKFTGGIPVEYGELNGMIYTPTTNSFLSSYSRGSTQDYIATFPATDLNIMWKRSLQTLPLDPGHNTIYSLLDLSMNQLSGEIPTALGSLKGLKTMNLSFNSLSGDIPNSFGGLENLESLDLSHNNLNGSILQSFTNLQQLTYLDVSNNHLTGPIPTGSQMDRMNDPNDFANNSGLCGMQIQVPCQIEIPSSPTASHYETEESGFSWKGAFTGFPVGFFLTLLIAFLSGWFHTSGFARVQGMRRRRTVTIFAL